MRKHITELQKHAEKIRLRAAERRVLRDQILSYMEYHPLPKKDARETATRSSQIFALFHRRYVKIAAAAFAVLVIVGVPLSAEQTLPGDVLYPVKVRFNEEVRSTLSLTPFQRIEWETKRVERRIAEARILAREGLLTEEVENAIEEDVFAHTEAAQKELSTLRESDADGAAEAEVTFESALDVQSAVLDTELEKNAIAATGGRTVEGVAEAVRNAKEASRQGGLAASSTPSYEGLTARVELETTRAYELFESIRGAVSDNEQADIEQRLGDVGRIIARAEVAHENEDDVEAIALLRGALSNAKKLVTFMTDIDIRETVLLDRLVPRASTDDERLEMLATIRADIENAILLAETATEIVEDELSLERLATDSARLEELLGTWDEELLSSDIDAVEKIAREAKILADDLLQFMTEIGAAEESEENISEAGGEQVAISNFEECVAATGVVMESFPRKCAAPDGAVFVEEVALDESTTTEETAESESQE